MGWLTGQDKGSKARDGKRGVKAARKCGRCNRPLNGNGKCPACSFVVRSLPAVKVESHACLDGTVRVHRNGICAGPC